MIIISIDAMGGDHGPEVTVPAMVESAAKRSDVRFIAFGREEILRPLIEPEERLKGRVEIVHAEIAVRMDDKPSQALRQGRWKSSMWKAIEVVKTGGADACVSAGNTGALMAMAKFCLRSMSDIERPAIAAIWPTVRGESVVLDVGATIGASSHQLIDFAILGSAMSRALFGIPRPTVGLLNIGVEEVKGQEEVKEAGRILRDTNPPSLTYHGFVEGNDIGKGTVDVVVTEGFSGNIALKTAEGTAKQIGDYLRDSIQRSFISKVGYLLAKPAFDRLRDKMNVKRANGGVFLGLNGLVVKSHGSADAESFVSAIDLACEMAQSKLLLRIKADLDLFHAREPDTPVAAKDNGGE